MKKKSIVTPYMKEYDDPQHKHMKKLIALEDRIARWKRVRGNDSIDSPNAVTEKDWDVGGENLKFVTDLRRKCSTETKYLVSKRSLKNMNYMWKQYKV